MEFKLTKSKHGGQGKTNLRTTSFERKKTIKEIAIGTIIGGILFGGIGVTAVTLTAEQVTYTPSDTNFQVNNSKEALDELYVLANNISTNGMAVISSSSVHSTFAYTTGTTNNNEYFSVLYSDAQSTGNITSTNTITIKKDCKVRISLMITAGTGVGQSFTLNINGTETTYTTNGVVYNSVVEMKANQTISLTSNGVSSMYQGASLVVTLE